MNQYCVSYSDANFRRVSAWSTEMSQRIEHDLGNERLLIVELARSVTVSEPIVVHAAIYRVYRRSNGQVHVRMSQTVRRNQVSLVEQCAPEREVGAETHAAA